MDVSIGDRESAMTVLCGLPAKLEHLIVAINAANDDPNQTLDFVKSLLQPDEQRVADRGNMKPVSDSGLLTSRNKCHYCHDGGHAKSRCWKNTPIFGPIVTNEKCPVRLRVPSQNQKFEDDNLKCLIDGEHSSISGASMKERIIYSGATWHICHGKRIILKLDKVLRSAISVGDNTVQIVGRGTVCLRLSFSRKSVSCIVINVLYAPSIGYTMISVSTMRHNNITLSFKDSCRVTKNDLLLAEGVSKHNRNFLFTVTETTDTNSSTLALVADLNLWHQKLAHVHPHCIHDMLRHGVVQGIKLDKKTTLTRCMRCVYEKPARASIPRTQESRHKEVLELFHIDVCAKYPYHL